MTKKPVSENAIFPKQYDQFSSYFEIQYFSLREM